MSLRLFFATLHLEPFLRILHPRCLSGFYAIWNGRSTSFFVCLPADFDFLQNVLLRIYHPLCGLSEACVDWFQTYIEHQKHHFLLTSSTIDTCIQYTPNGFSDNFENLKVPQGLTCLQTENTTNAGNRLFIANEVTSDKLFNCKLNPVLSTANPFIFIDATTFKHGSSLRCRSHLKLDISLLSLKHL